MHILKAHPQRMFASLLFCGFLSISMTTRAQESTSAAQVTAPEESPAPTIFQSANSKVEVGEIAHVPYRIDLPNNWNHHLILFFHGYSRSPLHYRASAPEPVKLQSMLRKGYAVAQSAYAQTGWALESGYIDSERLRKYFVRVHGQPKETYLVGESMGGALVMEVVERSPKPYTGVLNLCGAVGPTVLHINRRFALRAAFDFYFPGLLPKLDQIPSSYVESEALRTKLLTALNSKTQAAEAMRNLTGLHTNIEVARVMVYFTYVLGDLQRKAGGNPFDNRNTIYTGTSSDTRTDYALNDGVTRYAADTKARDYLLDYYTPTGKVTKPTLALHTVYDPLIPAETLGIYSSIVEAAGYSRNYVQQYVRREGHCAFTPEEVGRAFDELIVWTHGGKPPLAGLLK